MASESIANVAGNASEDIKAHVVGLLSTTTAPGVQDMFAVIICARMRVVSVDVNPQPHGKKNEAVVVCEMKVERDMTQLHGMMHGGCTATLIDVCTSMAVPALLRTREWSGSGLSQSLAVVYHAPAIEGETIRIVSTAKSGGKRACTIVCEVWGSNGLIASGTHVKMVQPSVLPKL